MKPLLSIQTVPINIEYTVKRASLRHPTNPQPRPQPRMNFSRQRSAPQEANENIAFDTYVAKMNTGFKPRYAVGAGSSNTAYSGGGVDGGSQQGDTVLGTNNLPVGGLSTAGSIVPNALGDTLEPIAEQANIAHAPTVGSSNSAAFSYSMDKSTFDWNINSRPQLEFIAGSIDFTILQYPEVIIEYLGSPIYVPASADPNYQPLPMDTAG